MYNNNKKLYYDCHVRQFDSWIQHWEFFEITAINVHGTRRTILALVERRIG